MILCSNPSTTTSLRLTSSSSVCCRVLFRLPSAFPARRDVVVHWFWTRRLLFRFSSSPVHLGSQTMPKSLDRDMRLLRPQKEIGQPRGLAARKELTWKLKKSDRRTENWFMNANFWSRPICEPGHAYARMMNARFVQAVKRFVLIISEFTSPSVVKILNKTKYSHGGSMLRPPISWFIL